MNAAFRQFFDLVRGNPLVGGCVALLLLLGGANYFFWNQRRTLDRQHNEARSYGESMLPVLASHARLTAQVASVQEAVELVERNLVAESDLAENYGYFYKLETASRARVSGLTQLNARGLQGNIFKAVPFAMRVTGSYTQLIAFVRAIETGPRIAKIREFDFSRGEGKPGILALDLTVELLGNK
jgi:Tfp pilus assembly protein PilO